MATTQAERDAALADAHQFGTQANLLLPKNDNAVIRVPNVSAKALGDAVVTSMQAHSEGPIQAFLSQFQHFYTAPRPGADVVGFNNDDLLVGGPGFNRLVGQGGNDTIDGGTGGPNIMQGGDGSDLYLMTAGQDLISDGILDNDVDIASYIRAPQGLVIDMEPLDGDQSTGFAAGDTLGGVEGVIGSNFDDVILGRSVLQGGSSSDVIDGAGGNDSLSGGGGSDTLRGGAGFDLIDGGTNEDNVGNPGPPDIAVWDAAPNAVHFFFNGSDIIVATAFEGVDTVRNVEALSFAGQLFGLNQLTPSQANLQIDSGGAQALTGGPGVDLLYGLDGNDRLEGAGAGDWLIGDAGNDTIIGGDGNDMGSGGGGNDSILGDGGNDQLVGGVGKDTIKGGAGNDRLSGNGGPDLIIANGGNDRVNGGSGNDVVKGGGGNDVLNGNGGADTIKGGAGNDNADGGGGGDSLNGNAGGDVLRGGGGKDHLNGGGGHDTIDGGKGNDHLAGGAMADTFTFADNFGHDTVSDFSANDHEDIDLSGVSGITGFHNLITHHLNPGPVADSTVIDDGAGNTIVVLGFTTEDFGTGKVISGADFIFT